MAWTTPKSWSVGELLTAANFNTHIRDNFNHLIARPVETKVHLGGTFSTASTSWQTVDATALGLNITTIASGRLLIEVNVYASAPSGGYFSLTVDGVNIGDATLGLAVVAAQQMYSFVGYVTGLASGSHTVLLRYKAVAGTVYVYAPTQIIAREV